MWRSTLFGQSYNSLVSNNFSFLRFPFAFEPDQSEADWVITGFAYDMATSGRSGARFGPEGIRRASINLAWEGKKFPWAFDLREVLKVVDAGDLVFSSGDSAQFCKVAEEYSDRLLKAGKKLLSLGGDHFITLPLLRSHAKKYGTMALLHFDAHTDTYDNVSEYDHGTMFYRAPKEGLIDPKHSLQIGIRTEYDPTLGYTVLSAPKANEMRVEAIREHIERVSAGLPIYLTFDIDCLDPAFAPGTGTPVMGGMSTDKILKIIRSLHGLEIVGMDVVEVAPSYDNAAITSLAGATLALEMLYLQGADRLSKGQAIFTLDGQ